MALGPHLNKNIVLRFTDGEEIEVLLLGINERENDLTFELRSLRTSGEDGSPYTTVGVTYVATLEDLESVLPID